MTDSLPRVTLHNTEGSSDKLYTVWISENPSGGYDLHTEWGRRLGPMSYGHPEIGLSWEAIEKAYHKLVATKIKGKYRPITGNDDVALAVFHARDGQDAKIPIKLLNAIDAQELSQYLRQPGRYAYQQKIDGHRRLLKIENGEVLGVNRRRLFVPVSPAIIEAGKMLDDDGIFDAEIVNNQTLYVFDQQRLHGKDWTKAGFRERLESLKHAMTAVTSPAMAYVPYCSGSEAECTAFVNDLRDRDAEGVVISEIDAPYRDGRPASYGPSVKYKFWNTLSAIVLAHNDQSSIAVGLLDPTGTMIDVGNVTVTSYPPLGSIVEIRYQYANALPGGRLYTATFRMIRDDIDAADCTTAQLVFKRESESL